MNEQVDFRVLDDGTRELLLPSVFGHPEQVFGGLRPDTIDYDAPLPFSAENPLQLILPPEARENYFCLQTGSQRNIVSARHFPTKSVINFRDFGGYRTADGRRVRWGCLFRSGHLSALTEADQEYLSALDIHLVFDLRREQEVHTQPARLPQKNPPRVFSLPITPGSAVSFFAHLRDTVGLDAANPAKMEEFMRAVNRDLALGQRERYTQLFVNLLREEPGRILINCTAGKDRTGFAVAMILAALGVTRQVLMEDYLLSRRCLPALQDRTQWINSQHEQDWRSDLDIEVLRPMLEVQPSYLQTAFDAVEQDFSSIDIYLEEALGVDAAAREELRRRFLED